MFVLRHKTRLECLRSFLTEWVDRPDCLAVVDAKVAGLTQAARALAGTAGREIAAEVLEGLAVELRTIGRPRRSTGRPKGSSQQQRVVRSAIEDADWEAFKAFMAEAKEGGQPRHARNADIAAKLVRESSEASQKLQTTPSSRGKMRQRKKLLFNSEEAALRAVEKERASARQRPATSLFDVIQRYPPRRSKGEKK